MPLYIKNMVCDRCILVVRQELDKLGMGYKNIQLGEVELSENISPEKINEFKDHLHILGFELLDDRKSTLVEKIKSAIIQLIQGTEVEILNKKLSVLLSEKLDLDYHYISGLFSSLEGMTIEKYVILQRIEKAKELLMYAELTLSEIADKLGYSSVQHLSQQFKKTTGLTPSHFKSLKKNMRIPLDKV
ncbi:MAG TPA: AraC family transcriptional regulator [Puia sp.]|nr:AraC family transcriptional regulator [Puia sp.]